MRWAVPLTAWGERLDNLSEPEKPENVIVFILTDGLENASTDYRREKVRHMIEHQESKYSWEFIYGGANQDAFTEAGGLGIKRKNTFNFDATAEGTINAYEEIMENYRMRDLSRRQVPEEPNCLLEIAFPEPSAQ